MNEKESDECTKRNLKGIELEKKGKIKKAMALYEENIKRGFEGNHPYDRLAIIYHRLGRIDDEIRILRKAISVFENISDIRSDREPKLKKFKKRLEKLLKTVM